MKMIPFFCSLTHLSSVPLHGEAAGSVRVYACVPRTEDICHETNSVSGVFPRYWWYHNVAVSALALQREKGGGLN